ncbi:MAG: DNA mismatch repair ATPase msh1 [Vezdaea aestivalis]|nr:MAG: DNA mismatch repair ATPase msh1 [Vezdaea aestivalis]
MRSLVCRPRKSRCLQYDNLIARAYSEGQSPAFFRRRQLGQGRRPFSRRAVAQPVTKAHQRTLKTVTKRRVDELPQGGLGLPPVEKEVERNEYPTVVKQAKENMIRYEDCVLLTRVGGFYELYFDQAEKYGRLLNLKVARKNTVAGPVPMAGFPFFQLDRYMKTLVQDMNLSVALSEEFALDNSGKIKAGGLLFDRRVSRIISAGTLIDENFMDPYENNFLLAIHVSISDSSKPHPPTSTAPAQSSMTGQIGLAWMDLSTGDFSIQTCNAESLPSAVASIGPREVIINQDPDVLRSQGFTHLPDPNLYPLTFKDLPGAFREKSSWNNVLESPLTEQSAAQLTNQEVLAGSDLLDYGVSHLQGLGLKLQPPVRRHMSDNLEIDRNTMRALEIKETLAHRAFKGSLLHAVRRTATKSGSRLLASRLASPSASLKVIEERLDLVTYFLHAEDMREQILALLQQTSDSQRLVQKFSLGRGMPDDLLSLSKTILSMNQVAELFDSVFDESVSRSSGDNEALLPVKDLVSRLNINEPTTLAQRINEAVDEEGVQENHAVADDEAAGFSELAEQVLSGKATVLSTDQSRPGPRASKPRSARTILTPARDIEDEIWIMKRKASKALDRLHEQIDELCRQRYTLAETLREQLGAPSLTLKWTPGLGHICHLKGKDTMIPIHEVVGARSVSSSKSTRSFYYPPWTDLGRSMDQLKLRIRAEEQKVFRDLSKQVILNLVWLRRNAVVLDELDIACSSALLAHEQSLTRPIMVTSNTQNIIGGRHPTVNAGLEEEGRSFTPNDCLLSSVNRIWLITGPNMGGKSTFLRQNALIYVLAQAGLYVPAKYVELGVIDKLFTRVGSADNLSSDQSTFMVEMMETAAILKGATERSFVVMDEVGRGTTPADGIAIGAACLRHLHNQSKCRTLFATHYHSLADMLPDLDGIEYYCTRLHDGPNASFSFDYRILKGVNRSSHALKTAMLAGLPKSVIEDARGILDGIGQESV